MSYPAISLSNLSKEYRTSKGSVIKAVSGLSFDVPVGCIFGFLGPNGAGKTTTIKMLLGFIRATSGGAEIFGVPIEKTDARVRVGYLAEQALFHPFLTPKEVLFTHASILGISKSTAKKKVDEIINRLGIEKYAKLPVGKLSKGMAQRVGLAAALVGSPELLILDEPGSGLDPIGRRELRNLLVQLRAEGKTIFLSTHLLSEAEAICDQVAMLNEGRLVAIGNPEKIKKAEEKMCITIAGLYAEISGLPDNSVLQLIPNEKTTYIEVNREDLFLALKALESCEAELLSVEQASETLEDAFVRLAA